jgi:hypothetical protein
MIYSVSALEHTQSTLFSSGKRPSFTPTQNNRLNKPNLRIHKCCLHRTNDIDWFLEKTNDYYVETTVARLRKGHGHILSSLLTCDVEKVYVIVGYLYKHDP